ncbi:hypothetical protein MUN78_10075 [Leucobacter allii]|uniref:Uncharacterized protein n=1 Tax=Leucobacter allii TaxID=2932247 RepID=A0ABY4FHA9_9MICO|nr:hypothetical protein [Leucobacter allii]UOQ56050.1 hypothetical protein MUN78_10075 [Leucobacter allii]
MTIIAESPAPATLDEWCAVVRRLHAEHAQPITDMTDPRVDEFTRTTPPGTPAIAYDVENYPKFAGERYFAKCVKLPPIPINGPDWATRHEVDAIDWPQVNIEFFSDEFKVGDVVAWASCLTTIQVAANEIAPDGTVRENGDMDITLVVDGHPIDFYDASVASLRRIAAVLLSVSLRFGEELGK